MKVYIKKDNQLTPFANLRIGEAWITKQASLTQVNTVYVKTGVKTYTQLSGGTEFNVAEKGSDVEFVRRFKIETITGKIIA